MGTCYSIRELRRVQVIVMLAMVCDSTGIASVVYDNPNTLPPCVAKDRTNGLLNWNLRDGQISRQKTSKKKTGGTPV